MRWTIENEELLLSLYFDVKVFPVARARLSACRPSASV